ncbi:class I SAM-dependent methyltransferase [Microbispora sp. RL4-1S]|uniref:Class I SAM-dependent methyltransferase n=1 Tax=Microbispora oryzae TaxID=2806554 RepID=A0A940WNT5_9ACTN|nr:class I SAM-dependent methyltransferase [Microbispora oryzae]MBP2706473.1 class I SAM-dependent methyltransferase [Microbispora oryzae]
MTETPHLQETRAAYDAVAVLYAELFRDHLATQPLDRSLLGAFAELAADLGAGPVGDLGCGPGRITAYLSSLGLSVFGVDLSETMVETARREHPDLRFEVGSMTDLDLADGSLGGAVAWYSIIHTPPEDLPVVFAEFSRVLAPGAPLILAFYSADAPLTPPRTFDHKVTPAYLRSPEAVLDLLRRTGFDEIAQAVREPAPDERFQQGYLLVRRAAAA